MSNIFALSFSLIMAFVFSAILFGIWLWAIIDCLRSDLNNNEKIIWVIVIVIANVLGAIIYFLVKGRKKSNKSQLRKSEKNKVLAGVCGGLGEYFNIDPTLIRLGFVLVTLISFGTGILLYLISAIIIPPPIDKRETSSKTALIIAGILILVVVLCLTSLIFLAAIMEYSREQYGENSAIISPTPINVVKEKIEQSYEHIDSNSSNLICSKMEMVKDDKCLQYNRDPYGVRIYNPECYEITCRYDDGSDMVEISTVVSGEKIQKMSFNQIENKERSNNSLE